MAEGGGSCRRHGSYTGRASDMFTFAKSGSKKCDVRLVVTNQKAHCANVGAAAWRRERCVRGCEHACMHASGWFAPRRAGACAGGCAARACARGRERAHHSAGGAAAACACAPPGACRGRSALGDGRRCRDGMADCIWAQGGEGRGAAGRRHSCTRRTLVIEYLWRTWQAGQCGHGAVAADPFDAVLTPGVTPRPRRAMDRSLSRTCQTWPRAPRSWKRSRGDVAERVLSPGRRRPLVAAAELSPCW